MPGPAPIVRRLAGPLLDARKKLRVQDVVDAVDKGGLAGGVVSVAWSAITGKPTTLAGYGITDGVSTSRTISTTAPLAGGGDLSANRTLTVSTMTGDSGSGGARGVVPAPAAGDATKFLRGDATWATPTASVADGDKGDITVSGSGATWTIDAGVVTLAKMADVATARILGRTTAGTGSPEALTGDQAHALMPANTTAYTSAGTTAGVAAPSWATLGYFRIVGGGGGGGSGRRGAASSLRGVGAGGAGGGYIEGWFHVSQLSGGTVDVIVGAGGGGGAAVTTNSTDGADGTAGGASYLQTGGVTIAYAPGGPGGAKGTSAGGALGGVATTTTAQWPGGNGGNASSSGASATVAAAGGGSGAGISAGNVFGAGGSGGAGATSRTGSTSGAAAGGNAGAGNAGTTPATPSTYQPGGGGGGGEQGNLAGSIAGGTGGTGKYGGGGGGGGSSTNGANSGGGGAGGDGFVILTWV